MTNSCSRQNSFAVDGWLLIGLVCYRAAVALTCVGSTLLQQLMYGMRQTWKQELTVILVS